MQERTDKASTPVKKLQTKAIVIANPTSGSYTLHEHQIQHIIAKLQQQGWQVELKLTRSSGDACRLAREAARQHIDVVIATGGDGTIHEVIQGLAGSETALGVLPSGTVNVWAREVGIPLDLNGASNVLLNGQTRRIDLGKIDDQYFLLMVGIGVDGEIAQAVEKQSMKRLKFISYLLMAAWWGARYPAFRGTINLGNREIKVNALQVIIGNTQLYGGAMKYTWQAKCDDGLLDLCVVRRQSVLRRAAVIIDFLLRRPKRHQWVRYEIGETIKIITQKPVAIQVDGEPLGHTSTSEAEPTLLSIEPQALKVIVPVTTPEDLFSRQPL
ncbi:diacylglycerol/lipid kinase family protein [Dictyobacter aurantiacus]|uniref:Diacylglycerol kinase n=1 Tax=Dictyobacter aurantiacus TaxID=1936993 RepID=A0A401ZB67_9CHLR|nr:diacylglycerol kinase family protein [Dictyobacter aurantiacus]GCE04099.1 diacylglycerol kinase [Dictyobacter aurantiacus]